MSLELQLGKKITYPTKKAMVTTNCLGMPRLRFSDFVQDTIGCDTTCTTNSKQDCPSYNSERGETWVQAVTLQDKLYGDAVNLKLTTSFFKRINITV